MSPFIQVDGDDCIKKVDAHQASTLCQLSLIYNLLTRNSSLNYYLLSFIYKLTEFRSSVFRMLRHRRDLIQQPLPPHQHRAHSPMLRHRRCLSSIMKHTLIHLQQFIKHLPFFHVLFLFRFYDICLFCKVVKHHR